MNITRLARLMAEEHGAYDGAKKLEARANYYSALAEAKAVDHRRMTRNQYAFRAMFWRSVSRVCIAKYSHKEGARV
jgi:hypothetical protein